MSQDVVAPFVRGKASLRPAILGFDPVAARLFAIIPHIVTGTPI
jgi:hypothetical protein